MNYYRLAPFCSWSKEDGYIAIETPDYRIKVSSSAEELLMRLQAGTEEESADIRAFAEFGIVVTGENPHDETLRRLEQYFNNQSISVSSVRKGATESAYELLRHCFSFKTEGGTEGHGQADERSLALLKAAAEVYERISCDAIMNRNLIVNDISNVPAVDLDSLVRYSSWQYDTPGFPYGTSPSGQWMTVSEVSTQKVFITPTETVCYPDRTGHRRITSTTSNGVACHTDLDSAIMSSALELIERDALMVHWYWGLAREQIIPPSYMNERVSRLNELGFECIFLNLTLEIVPAVVVFLRREAQSYPRLIMGMAAHSSVESAMDKALQEVELNVTFCGVDTPTIPNQHSVKNVMDHQFWYDQLENHREVMTLVGNRIVRTEDIPSGPRDVEGLACLLNERGFPWFITELNERGRDVTGLHVIRSLIGGLTPIGFGYMMEPLGMKRLLGLPMSVDFGHPDPYRQTCEGYKIQPFA